MFISQPRDESTILLMDLHLTKILAVGKPNFIEVNRIINIARSALGVFLGGRVGYGRSGGEETGDDVLLKLKVMSGSDSVRGAEHQNTFFVVSLPSPLRPHSSPPEVEKCQVMSQYCGLHYHYCKL